MMKESGYNLQALREACILLKKILWRIRSFKGFIFGLISPINLQYSVSSTNLRVIIASATAPTSLVAPQNKK